MDEDCVAREALGRQWMMAWKGVGLIPNAPHPHQSARAHTHTHN